MNYCRDCGREQQRGRCVCKSDAGEYGDVVPSPATLFDELQKTERLLQEQRKRINEMQEECARLAEKAAALRKALQEVVK